jgi:nicotinamidase-related amidase
MIEKFFLERNNTIFVIIDIQEKLSSKMKYRTSILNNTIKLINSCKILNIPIIVTEQYPKGIGQTEKEIIEHLPEYNPILKMTFSCYGEENFRDALNGAKKSNIIIAGIEAHVCVLQTALDCIKAGYNVHVIKDAICSREESNMETAIKLMFAGGAVISSTEIAIFQLLKECGTEEFKKIMPFIK